LKNESTTPDIDYIPTNPTLGTKENMSFPIYSEEELSDRSGISVRTIQRIESGHAPKGHTLKALAKSLDINENELIGNKDTELDYKLIKIINLSSLPLVILPLASIAIPFIIMLTKKQFNPLTKQIISTQILWTIFSIVFFFLIAIFVDGIFLGNVLDLALVWMILPVLINIFIILRNAIEIAKNQKLWLGLNFSII